MNAKYLSEKIAKIDHEKYKRFSYKKFSKYIRNPRMYWG